MKLHLDFETRSEADLNKVGAWAYASHPSTEIICMGGGFVAPGERVRQITRQECLTPRFHGPWSSNYDNVVISAHNAAFEYAIWNCILHKDRKSTRLNSSHQIISYAVFCLKKKKK